MRGEIFGFDPDTNNGAIVTQDGGRYDFTRHDWRGNSSPRRGLIVDFTSEGLQAKQVYPVAVGFDPREADTAQIIYILYLVSLLTGITGLIGLVMAYANRDGAPEWVQTHYRFQIRTFWIGCLYGLASVLTAIVVVGFFLALFTLIWWIVRCAKGLKYQSQGAPYPNAGTWLW